MIGLGVGFSAGNIVLSQFMGPSKPSPEKSAPYAAAFFGAKRP